MTIQTEVRTAGPFAGNGVTVSFPFSFVVLEPEDVQLLSRTAGLAFEAVPGSHFDVTLNPDQNVAPGGTLIYPGVSAPFTTPVGAGVELSITTALPNTQTTNLPSGGRFFASMVERTFDRIVILIQQLAETVGRALTLPPGVIASGLLPFPEAFKLLGWNAQEDALQNYSISDLFTEGLYADYAFDVFTGNGSTVNFVLTRAPGNLANLDVSVNGVTLVPGDDYTLSSNVLSFVSPPLAAAVVLARYGSAVQQVSAAFSTELQVATAGQTVLVCGEVSYQPGVNNLAVYVNGLRLLPGVDYVETDETTITFTSGLAAGDEVFLLAGRVVNDGLGAEQVSYLPPFTGGHSRTLQDKLAEWVTPLDFGAAGDGATDDTLAIQRALASGQPLNWLNRVYRVTSTVAQAYTSSALRWRSEGAIVQLVATNQYAVLDLSLGAGEHTLDGQLTVNAELSSYVGVRFQATAGTPDLRVTGLSVFNVRRSGTLFSDGDGILFMGPFASVTVNNPIVRNCRMAPGAGVAGVSGIFGISAIPNGLGGVKRYTITNPQIDGVLCEDTAYLYDQDGLRFIVSTDPAAATPVTWDISGGVVKNPYGRSVKSQAEFTTVRGTKFIRTEGFARGYGNEEFDFQKGGGIIKDIQCIYDGSVPEIVVQTHTSRDAKETNSPSISGVHVYLGALMTLARFFTNVPFQNNRQVVKIRDVDIVGPGELETLGALFGTGDQEYHLLISDVSAAPTTRFFTPSLRLTGSATGTIKASRIVNTGPTPIALIPQDPVWPCLVSAHDCVNVVQYSRGHSILNEVAAGSGFFAVNGIIPEGVTKAGALRPYSFTLAPDEIFTIPSGTCVEGNASNAVLVAVSDADRDSQVLLFAGDNGVVKGTTSANWSASTTISEPGSGNFRVWRSGGLNFSNRTATTRTFTVALLG